MSTGISEHFLLLRDDMTELQAQQLLTRDIDLRLPHGRAKVGVDVYGGRHLLVPVSSDAELRADRSSAALTINAFELEGRGAPVRYVDLACTDSKLELVFERLIEDVIGRIEKNPNKPVPAVYQALHDWKALLAPGGTPLSRESLLGLFGELTVLKALLAAGDSQALDAWKGPAGAIHDFERSGIAFEVKASASIDGAVVSISNLDQLDSSSLHSLHLVAVHLRESAKGESLDSLMRSIIDMGVDERSLISSVAHLGYIFESGVLDDERFEVRRIRVWPVDDSFPGLRRNLINPETLMGVSHVRYSLELDACPGEMRSVDVGTLWLSLGNR